MGGIDEGQSKLIEVRRDEFLLKGWKLPIIDGNWHHGVPLFGLFPNITPIGSGKDNSLFEQYFANVFPCTEIEEARQ